jgi:hypothetical protein
MQDAASATHNKGQDGIFFANTVAVLMIAKPAH